MAKLLKPMQVVPFCPCFSNAPSFQAIDGITMSHEMRNEQEAQAVPILGVHGANEATDHCFVRF
jgi:hypothetical protein